ncbi:MAG: dihydrofolate reductase [Desulfatitalea sp.]|nr:dihydrofolate reductase [Desulfatitalea sp.]
MKITLIMAMTADGKIARHNTHYPDWTGKADKKMFKQLTTAAGVVIMGSRTYGTIGKPLPQRLNWVMTRSPQRYASSEHLVFSDDPPTVIVDKLVARGYSAAALTGGATINSLFARARLIDDLVLTVTPKLFGQGLSLFAEPVDADLELLSHRELEPGILVLHYRCRYP